MTDMEINEQNIAIAEFLGWKRCQNDGEGNYHDDPVGPYWRNPLGYANRTLKPAAFSTDANTRKEMLAVLEKRQWQTLLDLISYETSDGGINAANGWDIVDKTAKFCLHLDQPTFTKLFLQTVGKWRE